MASRLARASPMTAQSDHLAASQRFVLIKMNVASGYSNTDHEPVVKSCSRVPTATITSASSATALAELEPMVPSVPTL